MKSIVIVETKIREVKNQLVRKGFEVIGEVGDSVSQPIIYTLRGNEKLISPRESLGVNYPSFKKSGGRKGYGKIR